MAAADANHANEMTDMKRVLIGILGGLAAIATKLLSQDGGRILAGMATSDTIATNALIGYALGGTLVVFLGAASAWVSKENHRGKLFVIAVSAPAMITTMTGGKETVNVTAVESPAVQVGYGETPWPSLISAARAEEEGKPRVEQGHAGPRTTYEKVEDGLKFFLRVGEPRYWVVVGSYDDKGDAAALVEKIDEADAELGAFIGLRNSKGIYPVIVGKYAPLAESKAILERAEKLEFLKAQGPFLSPG